MPAQILCNKRHPISWSQTGNSRLPRGLAVIALFANGVKGVSALQMSRNMNVGPSRFSSRCTNCARLWDR
jgi:hypothetical protein